MTNFTSAPLSKLSELPVSQVKAVFSDLDDTLTFESLLLPSTLKALHQLSEKGLKLVIVSGRPAGWADTLMRLLPLDAFIFENGAGLSWREGKKVKTLCLAKNQDLSHQKKILEEIYQKVKSKHPGAKLATDQPFRLFDYAIDFNEEPPFLEPSEVQQMMHVLNSHSEITAKLSSIHINYWVGKHTKLTACEYWIKRWGTSQNVTKESIVFSGDSPNDEPLFEFFPLSVGVANISRFLPQMKFKPRFLATLPGGKGFEQLAAVILESAKESTNR